MSVFEGETRCELDTKNSDKVNLEAEKVQNNSVSVNISSSSHVEDSLNDSDLLKGLLTDSFCQVCEAVLLFESQRVSHYEGKKHAQRVRIYLQSKKAEKLKEKQGQETESFQCGNVDPEKFCELCNMVFSSSVVARSHYEGKVHAKNMRKSDTITSTAEIRTLSKPLVAPVPVREGVSGTIMDQEQKDISEVDLRDPEKYCKLCTASFNNPIMAQQHYSGRKHQRNQTRQETLSKLSQQSEHASSLTCPVCCVTLSSVEMYQAHMQGNKHNIQEKKIVGLCSSQKKVYNSFQDELADYIQVQKARGLEPKTGSGSTGEEDVKEREKFGEEPQIPPPSSLPPPSLPPSSCYLPPLYCPPFQPRVGHFGFRARFPEQHQWSQGYKPHPPPLIPGLTGKLMRRRRSPDSLSPSSSSSDSSSYTSSSSSDSDSSTERRRRRNKRKEQIKKRREEDDSDSEDERRRKRRREDKKEQTHAKKTKRKRRMSFEEDDEKEWRKRKDSSEEDESRRKSRGSKKSKRRKEGHGKKEREEEEGIDSGQSERVQAVIEEHTEEKADEIPKRRKEKKKAKDKMEGGDKRTDEEKLWDETILGVF